MLVYRRLLTTRLHGKAAVSYQITLEKQQKLFVKGYNLEVRDVIKYTRKHRATDVGRNILRLTKIQHHYSLTNAFQLVFLDKTYCKVDF